MFFFRLLGYEIRDFEGDKPIEGYLYKVHFQLPECASREGWEVIRFKKSWIDDPDMIPMIDMHMLNEGELSGFFNLILKIKNE